MNTPQRKFFTPGGLVVLIIFIIYAVLTFITPQTATSQEHFQISNTALFWIRVSVIVPYFLMWFTAFYSMRSLQLVGKKAGEFATIAKWFSLGFLLLLLGTITTTILGAVQSLLVFSSPSFLPILTILINYLYTFLPLGAFLCMYQGLKKSEQPDTFPTKQSDGAMIQSILTVVVIGLAYIPLILSNPNRQIAFSVDSPASYYLPDFLIIITLVLPILVGWALGIVVALKLNRMFLAFDLPHAGTFVNGIFLVIFSSMILQAILSLGTARLYEFGLGIILILIYILIFFQTAGYVLTARGVRSFDESQSK